LLTYTKFCTAFADCLAKEFSGENLTFYQAATQYKEMYGSETLEKQHADDSAWQEQRHKKAMEIYETFVAENAKYQVNLQCDRVKGLYMIALVMRVRVNACMQASECVCMPVFVDVCSWTRGGSGRNRRGSMLHVHAVRGEGGAGKEYPDMNSKCIQFYDMTQFMRP
jgi:hypothetical protein